MGLSIHSQISTVQPLKFGSQSVISFRTWLLSHAVIKVYYASKRAPQATESLRWGDSQIRHYNGFYATLHEYSCIDIL